MTDDLEDARRRIEAADTERAVRGDGGESLEEVATVLSHDLQNALTVAQGYLELAREAEDGEPIEHALDALDRAEEITDGVVALARTGERVDATAPVDLADVSRTAWTTVSDPGATLEVPDDATIEADERSLAQLLENLFRNSVDHGSTGGDVTIRVGTFEDGFYVADDGPGIPPEDRERVFDRGYSGDDDHHGVGLTIVRRIAEAHGWALAATESESGGARIEVVRGVVDREDNA